MEIAAIALFILLVGWTYGQYSVSDLDETESAEMGLRSAPQTDQETPGADGAQMHEKRKHWKGSLTRKARNILNSTVVLAPMDPSYQDTFTKDMHKIVHLDLKGAPPRVGYLEVLFPLFKAWGATGILLEYEDMFPYSGTLEILRARNAYTESEIRTILTLARENGLEVIPLVQTFGHMEFVLKYKEHAHLRELDTNPMDIRYVKVQDGMWTSC